MSRDHDHEEERNWSEHLPKIASPPRHLSFFARCRLLFGGALGLFGWGFFAMGMVFTMAFGVPKTLMTHWQHRQAKAMALGVVTDSEETNMESNEDTIYRVWFRYTPRNGEQRIEGASYRVLRGMRRGRRVRILYDANRPTVARIRGLSPTPFGAGIAFVVLFPVVGFALLLLSLYNGFRAIHLLKEGHLALGTFISMTETGSEINDEPVMKLTFSFEADDGRTYEVTERTHEPDSLLDDEYERIFYDPLRPQNAVLFDSLPGGPELDKHGEFVFSSGGWASFLVPLACVCLIALTAYFTYAS
jgi:hypothetical protein